MGRSRVHTYIAVTRLLPLNPLTLSNSSGAGDAASMWIVAAPWSLCIDEHARAFSRARASTQALQCHMTNIENSFASKEESVTLMRLGGSDFVRDQGADTREDLSNTT
jgi:hypothetical protein